MNQRIEAYWSNFRKDRWKHFLHSLVDLELFDPTDSVQVDCLRFCFIELLCEEVKEVATALNQHIIPHPRNVTKLTKLWNAHKVTVSEKRVKICVYFSVKNT